MTRGTEELEGREVTAVPLCVSSCQKIKLNLAMAAIAVRIPSVIKTRLSAIEMTSCNVYLSGESTSWLEGCRARVYVGSTVMSHVMQGEEGVADLGGAFRMSAIHPPCPNVISLGPLAWWVALCTWSSRVPSKFVPYDPTKQPTLGGEPADGDHLVHHVHVRSPP